MKNFGAYDSFGYGQLSPLERGGMVFLVRFVSFGGIFCIGLGAWTGMKWERKGIARDI